MNLCLTHDQFRYIFMVFKIVQHWKILIIMFVCISIDPCSQIIFKKTNPKKFNFTILNFKFFNITIQS